MPRTRNVNKLDKEGFAPLHGCAHDGDTEGIRRLLQQGADINVLDFDQRTPVYIAAAAGQVNAVRVLIDAGCDLEVRDDVGYKVYDFLF